MPKIGLEFSPDEIYMGDVLENEPTSSYFEGFENLWFDKVQLLPSHRLRVYRVI